MKNESQRGPLLPWGPCLLSSLGRSPFNALSFPLEWGFNSSLALALALAVFGRHRRTEQDLAKKRCPMSLPHAAWAARAARVGVCVWAWRMRSRPDRPAFAD